jgi:hypothetical protein
LVACRGVQRDQKDVVVEIITHLLNIGGFMKAIITIILFSIVLFSITMAQNIEFVGSYQDTVIGLFVSGDYAYLNKGSAELEIINISIPTLPSFISSFRSAGQLNSVFVSNNLAYLACDSGLQIVDVQNPQYPTAVGYYDAPGIAADIFIQGHYAYIAEKLNWNGLGIIAVYDPANPTFSGSHEALSSATDIFVSGYYAYLICRDLVGGGNFRIIDVTIPTHPVITFGWGPNLTLTDSYILNNYCYLTYENGIIEIHEIGGAPYPGLGFRGACNTPGYASGICIVEHYACVADGYSGLQVINIDDPYNPVITASYDTPGWARKVFASGNFIYVADSSSMQILRFTPEEVENENLLVPESFSLSPNYPNPFNPITTIQFDLPKPSQVSLDIYDLLGRKIETLVSGKQEAGTHSVVWDGRDKSSGIYFYKLQVGDFTETKRMLLLK